jgi:hypothetical protein
MPKRLNHWLGSARGDNGVNSHRQDGLIYVGPHKPTQSSIVAEFIAKPHQGAGLRAQIFASLQGVRDRGCARGLAIVRGGLTIGVWINPQQRGGRPLRPAIRTCNFTTSTAERMDLVLSN